MGFNPVQQMLTGENAFYKYDADNYRMHTKLDMNSSYAPRPIYSCEIENKVWRVVKDILSVIIFPIGLALLIHSLAGKIFLPASSPETFLDEDPNCALLARCRFSYQLLDPNSEWKVKRIAIEVDGYTIDAAIMGKESTFGNGRWLLTSNGNGSFYESRLNDRWEMQPLLNKLKSNAIVFNYPGVGSSTGMVSRSAMAKAYQGILRFLEDKEKGIGAKEIIGLGHSIGGGAQAEGLQGYKLKKDIKYVFTKSRTFSDMSAAAKGFISSKILSSNPNATILAEIAGKIAAFLTMLVGWNISTVDSSKELEAPEIIMQRGKPKIKQTGNHLLDGSDIIEDDDIITAEASLAAKLAFDPTVPNIRGTKEYMLIRESHNDTLESATIKKLAGKIKKMLKNGIPTKPRTAPVSQSAFMLVRELPAYLSAAYAQKYKNADVEENVIFRIVQTVVRFFALIKELVFYKSTQESFKENVEKLKIDFAELNQQVEHGTRPICAYFVSSKDHNGAILGDRAYYYHHYKIKQFQEHYDVSGKVVANDDEMFAHLKALKEKFPGREIKVVDLVSHGGQKKISLDKPYTSASARKDDFKDCARDAVIILDACSTGDGTNPLAERIAKKNRGKTVIAPGTRLFFSKPLFKEKNGAIKVKNVVHGFAIANASTAKKFKYKG